MEIELYIWLVITALALVVEFSTAEMVSIWFIGGGIVALILSVIGVNIYIQITAFTVVSILAMFLFRKYVMDKINRNIIKTNADTAIGKDYKLLTAISFNNAGSIKVNDIIWTAVSKDPEQTIEEGKIVTVKEINGNKFIVEEKK